ncbi:ABC transporter ATP-binding protein [Pseudomonas daroniae]|uniref:Spermidine/putrescine import ATP-binding protein PotA n=1 Tax=Phytopseudomonas daroniae TaxID=2487519 RepID=A0A4Q9QTJ4_9GAMM|nr:MULTISPECIES: ABC transporter ATP-binding protein [Pseudomonas]TBU82970.1 ABC transporter ATP-binding protein [Pseudomonas sp. FRB 228]TBU84017.1 ABC transporter ATP-binding protein [Pseudomonas daroniae]TBU93195.1 ABC transporter ATP-binding protein [Pseudomonas daroniae]
MTVFTQTAPVVEIRAAVKHYRAPEGHLVRAIDGLDLAVGANEFVTLLGPSGCGKTTLLRTISGFEQLDGGELLIQGLPMNAVPPHRRPVHTVFQSYALFPHMSIGDNVGYALDVRGVGKAEKRQRVGEALELVGLAGMQLRKPGQLSGGQQQRVALARAIVDRPALLLLDEPLSALDRQLRQAMQRELKNLQHELGIAFVFVTHDQEEALTMSDRIVVLDGGHIQQIGAPAEIYQRPANAFVAGFIGESNLFDVHVTAVDQGVAYLMDSQGDLLRVRHGGLQRGQYAQLMLRPEQFHLHRPGEGFAALDGQLEQVLFIGKDFELLLRTAHGRRVKAVLRDAALQGVQQLRPGAALQLWYGLEAAHLIPGGA